MRCAPRMKEIERYDPAFHRLRLDERRAVDICQGCIDAFVTRQGAKLASLFPTKALKKAYGKRQADRPLSRARAKYSHPQTSSRFFALFPTMSPRFKMAIIYSGSSTGSDGGPLCAC